MSYSIVWYPKTEPNNIESLTDIRSYHAAIDLLIEKITQMTTPYNPDDPVKYDEWDEIIVLVSHDKVYHDPPRKYYLPNGYVIELVKNEF